MPFEVSFTTSIDDDRSRRFQVHHFYIAGIGNYLGEEYGSSEFEEFEIIKNLVDEQNNLRSFKKIMRRSSIDLEKLSQYLTLAWVSELQLRLAILSNSSLLRYSNAWAPIHCYYAVYMSAQAWFLSMGNNEIVDNHTSSLNALANQIKDRQLFPLPWSVTCSGCPSVDRPSYSRMPSGVDPYQRIELLSRPTLETFWPRYCKMLDTTRRKRLEHNFNEWKRQNARKKMFKHEKIAVAKKISPTTIFDFFWRLRVRSNYRDVRTYIMSPVSDQQHEEFYFNLLLIAEATCTLIQSLVVAYAGKQAYNAALDDFIGAQRYNVDSVTEIFSNRRQLISD